MSGTLLVGLVVTEAPGQAGGLRVYDEQLRVALDEQVPEAKEIGLSGGGWFNFAFFRYDDQPSRRVRTLRQYQIRGYANVNVYGVHQFYIRASTGWDDWNSGDNPGDDDGDEYHSPDLERAWYQFNLAQLIRNQTGSTPPYDFRFKVGRAFAQIGTALVLSTSLDMLQWEVDVGDFRFMSLLGKTIRESDNIDDSLSVADHQKRCIWGVQLSYDGFDHHRPFAYFLGNHDRTGEDPVDPYQAYDYTSRYVGVGTEGTMVFPGLPDGARRILQNLAYSTEIVGEWGRTYSEGVMEGMGQDRIEAMAYDLMLTYYFDARTQPKVDFEYLFASGDPDRRSSATSTVGGNRSGTKDHAFNAFGFRDTGLALGPRMSNLHMYALGASFLPLEHHELFKKLEVGTKVFFFHKAAENGPISDPTSTNPSRWLGWEWDIYCNWRITSDLSWSIQYGAFQPGAAFTDNDCRQFLSTSVSLSF